MSFLSQVIANFVFKFPFFRYHCENPRGWCMRSAVSLILAKLYPILCSYSFFRYHGNKGPSVLNFNGTIKLHYLKNPLLGARISALSLILAKLYPTFVLKCTFFRYHGNQGPSVLNVSGTIKLHYLENPLVGARFSAVSVILA